MVEAPQATPAKKPVKQGDQLGHLILAAPIFLLYQLGLLVSPKAANGADPLTRLFGLLAGLSAPIYLGVVAVLILVYALVLRGLSRRHRFRPRRFPLVLLESLAYALLLGPVANLVLHGMHLLGSWVQQMGPLDRVIASAGAGFYEELIFRLAGVGGLAWALGARGMKRLPALAIAAGVSSLVFSAMHYIGPGSDGFEFLSFLYRFLLGLLLALIFALRGFATAVYTHFLYDVYVMLFILPFGTGA